MLFVMYGDSWASWFGATVKRWISSGYSVPSTIEALNQPISTIPSGHVQRVNAPATSNAAASPAMNVRTSRARN